MKDHVLNAPFLVSRIAIFGPLIGPSVINPS
jgi:hypothetical protein